MSPERKGFGSGLKRTFEKINPFHSKNEDAVDKVLKRVQKLPQDVQLEILAKVLFLRRITEGTKIEERGLPFQLISDTGRPDVLARIALASGLLSESFPVSRTAIEPGNLGTDGKGAFLRVQVLTEVPGKALALIFIPNNFPQQIKPGSNIGHIKIVDPRSLLPLNQES